MGRMILLAGRVADNGVLQRVTKSLEEGEDGELIGGTRDCISVPVQYAPSEYEASHAIISILGA